MRSYQRYLIDFICAGLLLVWLGGGLFGPDAKRIVLVLILIAFAFTKRFSLQSVWKALCDKPQYRRGVLWAAFVTSLLLGIFKTYGSGYEFLDQGYFHQTLWSLLHGKGFHCTIINRGSFFNGHFSPSIVLLAPLFFIFNSHPITLQIASSMLVWGGVYAWMSLAEQLPGAESSERKTLSAGIVVFAFFFDSLWANFRWGFHESQIAFCFISFALLFFFTKRFWWCVASLVIAAFSKEIELVDVAFVFFLLSFLIKEKEKKILLLVFSIVTIGIFILFPQITQKLSQWDGSTEKLLNRFELEFGYLGAKSPTGLAMEILFHPIEVVKKISDHVGLGAIFLYIIALFTTFVWAPLLLLVKDKQKIGILVFGVSGSVLSAFLAEKTQTRDLGHHYVLMIWPIFAVLSLFFLKNRKFWLYAMIAYAFWTGGLDYWKLFREDVKLTIQQKSLREKLSAIPPEDSVVSGVANGVWLSNREAVTLLSDSTAEAHPCPNWILTWVDQKDVVGRVFSGCKLKYVPLWTEANVVAFKGH